MKRINLLLLLLVVFLMPTIAQKSSLLVLGDLHYDLLEDHDMDWLKSKPDDLRQVTEEYSVYTEKNWNDFMVILRNKAIVLCAHLHRYSVVRRNTKYGPIVQIMVTSVISDRNYLKPSRLITEYGPSLAVNVPDWQPETLEARKTILAEEAKYVTFYKQTDLPGYALIKLNEKKGTVHLEYYAAFGQKPYDKADLTKLMKE